MPQNSVVATVSSKGQLTLPKPIRIALGLATGTKLSFTMVGNEMRVVKIEGDGGHHDPALSAFLDMLSKDIAAGNLKTQLPTDVIAYARTRDLLNININEGIEGDVEL